jgi:hypothetical protein
MIKQYMRRDNVPTLDLCIVAGRRPDLLEATLTSFQNKIFSSLPIRDVFVNIDPIFGTHEDHLRCIQIVRLFFPRVVIFEPEVPCFGAAVKRLWAATSAEYVFHLEDDWIALAQVGEEIFDPFSDPAVAQVSFNTKEKRWDISQRGPLHQRRKKIRILGFNIPLPKIAPVFTTSPSILRGQFARRCSELMDASLDPEKQLYKDVNLPLKSYTANFKNLLYPSSGEIIIKDIGRHWRNERHIEKIVKEGRSIWVSKPRNAREELP